MKLYIGIDPGINGGIACLDKKGKMVYLDVMSTIKIGTKNRLNLREISSLLFGWASSYDFQCDKTVAIIAIEHQRAMPKQGVSSTFTIGQGFGQLEGICAGLNLPYTIVMPREWQKEMFKGLPKGKPKDHSKLIAQQLFPDITFKKSARCTKIHDGMTDAILIAEYARRKL
jgi:Holliday junction resolvasome RuvABC endonuclease subunit